MEFVKSESYGTTINSYGSEAIKKVTFYNVMIENEVHYFAIVCFKPNDYSYNCKEYIYLVDRRAKSHYSMNYHNSAGKAFWKYIQPYNAGLGCGPDLD